MKLAIVDDNEIEQEIILNTLNAYHKESGISLEIQSFSDGDSFLNAYKSGNYDLIFMDIFLKNLNGIDIVRKIRQSDLKVLIVFLTMRSDHLFEAAPLHFFDYILKPFEYKQIFHVLNDARQILPQSKNEDVYKRQLQDRKYAVHSHSFLVYIVLSYLLLLFYILQMQCLPSGIYKSILLPLPHPLDSYGFVHQTAYFFPCLPDTCMYPGLLLHRIVLQYLRSFLYLPHFLM